MKDEEYPWMNSPWENRRKPRVSRKTPPKATTAPVQETTAENDADTIQAATTIDPQSEEETNKEYLWLTRLLRRLTPNKETRLVPWDADPQQHLLNALAIPEIAGKPLNMPPGIWYWVTRASENGEEGWYILLMVISANRPNPTQLSTVSTQITDVLTNAGYKVKVERHRLSPETLQHLPYNTRRLLGPTKRYRGKAFHVLRYHLKPAASS